MYRLTRRQNGPIARDSWLVHMLTMSLFCNVCKKLQKRESSVMIYTHPSFLAYLLHLDLLDLLLPILLPLRPIRILTLDFEMVR